MAVVMGPDGQLINTSNINSGVIGSSLIPNITPNIGALSTIDKPVTNADGTITLPTIEMRSNDPGLEAGQLQKIYGTDLMPYFDWVSTYQTGTMTYDPTDDNSAAELEAINEEFKTKHGISAQDAALKLQMAQAARKGAGAIAGQVAGKTAQAMVGGAGFGEGALAGINTLNPLKGMMGGKTAAPAMFGVDGGTRTFTNVQDAKAYKSLFPDSYWSEGKESSSKNAFIVELKKDAENKRARFFTKKDDIIKFDNSNAEVIVNNQWGTNFDYFLDKVSTELNYEIKRSKHRL